MMIGKLRDVYNQDFSFIWCERQLVEKWTIETSTTVAKNNSIRSNILVLNFVLIGFQIRDGEIIFQEPAISFQVIAPGGELCFQVCSISWPYFPATKFIVKV